MGYRALNVRQLVSINIAILTVLAVILWGLGRFNIILPLGMAGAAVLSVWLTDVTRRFSLNGTAINVALILIMAGSIWRLAQSHWLADLIVMCDAFVCVQMVLVFEKKSRRTWWDLLSLSLFQVLLSTLLDQGPLFAVILLAYVFFGLCALALLLLCKEQIDCEQASHEDPASGAKGSAGSAGRSLARLALVAPATLTLGPLALFLRYRETERTKSGGSRSAGTAGGGSRRWPLLNQRAVLCGPADCAIESVEVDRGFWYRMARLALATTALSMAVFYATPRFGGIDVDLANLGHVFCQGRWSDYRRSVGFTRQVRLGEIGSLTEDPSEVLQIQFADCSTDQRYPVKGGLYVRGAIMTQYRNGRWNHRRYGSRARIKRLRSDETASARGLVRQKITLYSTERDELFCVWPFLFLHNGQPVWFERGSELLRCRFDPGQIAFSFDLATTAFIDGLQVDLTPSENAVDQQALSQCSRETLSGLAELADRWMIESGVPADDPIKCARVLETNLLESDRFSYSLDAPPRDESLDPIEDFVINHPQGNCEHFATALALMLRSQGIPARLVVGYKSGEYSYISQAYRVRHANAHAWVEAYIPPDDLPRDVPQHAFSDWSNGGWLRLDPTPSGSAGAAMAYLLERGSWFQWLRFAWTDHVLRMSSARQREAFFAPLSEWTKTAYGLSLDPFFWRYAFGRFTRGGGLLLMVVSVGLLLACFKFRPSFFTLSLTRADARGGKSGNDARQIAFYRRLETLLSRHGLTRPASQTQREFARESGTTIAASTGKVEIADLPLTIVEAFYQVRFGGTSLAGDHAAAIDRALEQIKRATNGRT